MHAAAQIIRRAEASRQQRHSRAAKGDAQEIIGDGLAHVPAGKVHQRAEQNGRHATAQADAAGLQQGQGVGFCQSAGQGEGLRRSTDQASNDLRCQGGHQAGQQRAGVNFADVDDLNDEDRRGNGRAKERGEQRCHAAQLENAVVVIEGLGHVGHRHADGAAQLQCSTLAARGAAGQMGQGGGDEDRRGHLEGHALLGAYGADDLIRADGQGQLQQPVQPGDHQARNGHQPGQPGGVLTQVGGFFHRDGERAAYHAANGAHCCGHHCPDHKGAGVIEYFLQLFRKHGICLRICNFCAVVL